MSELWRLTADTVASMVRSRAVSAVEMTRAALDRLDRVNPMINAVVDVRPEEALAQAARVDDAYRLGEIDGPLIGVPVTVKVNVDQAGFATTNGLKAQANLMAASNSPVVDNLLAAGAVILGRTNTPAFSYRWFTSNRLHGTTRNPRDPSITPGGSSGGAAAAVAAGLCAIGHGTDIAGSIRYPAYACGVHGLRPSLGRVPAFNASSPERNIGGQLMAVSGPIARSVADLRLALAALAVGDWRDPWWVPAPLEGPSRPRIAALCSAPSGFDVQDEVRRAVHDAGRRLADAGWHVEEVDDLPPLSAIVDLQTSLWLDDGFDAKMAEAEAEGDPGALAALHGRTAAAMKFDMSVFSSALTQRATFIREWQAFLDRFPVVIMPVSGEPPFPDDLDLRGPESYDRVWKAQVPQIAIPFLGLPALTLTTDTDRRGTAGVQIVASRFREDLCLAAGAAIEARGPRIDPIDPSAPVP